MKWATADSMLSPALKINGEGLDYGRLRKDFRPAAMRSHRGE